MKYLIFVVMLICNVAFSADALLVWTPPTNLESGQAITTADLGGYEIHYRKIADAATVPDTVILIPDGKATSYLLIGVSPDSYLVSIAVYDLGGLYSKFVTVTYKATGKPGVPTAFKITPKITDVPAVCIASSSCKVAVSGEWK